MHMIYRLYTLPFCNIQPFACCVCCVFPTSRDHIRIDKWAQRRARHGCKWPPDAEPLIQHLVHLLAALLHFVHHLPSCGPFRGRYRFNRIWQSSESLRILGDYRHGYPPNRMMSNNAASGSGIRHRHDGPSTLASRQSSESYRSDRSLRRSIRRDKGKRRAFGWGMGQEGWVEEGFRRFGEHCARNQVRIHV